MAHHVSIGSWYAINCQDSGKNIKPEPLSRKLPNPVGKQGFGRGGHFMSGLEADFDRARHLQHTAIMEKISWANLSLDDANDLKSKIDDGPWCGDLTQSLASAIMKRAQECQASAAYKKKQCLSQKGVYV